MMSNFLENKTAIVTGGSGTIGKAITKALLTSGCNVFITGRNQERLDAAAADLTRDDANHGEIHTFRGDVLNEADVTNMFQEAERLHGSVDLLINNAGTVIPGPTHEMSVEDFDNVMRVNVTGPFLCSKVAINMMKPKGKGGRIINIGSLSASSPRPDQAPYTTSKFALLGLTNSLALDCRKDNIAVGIIHPGNVMSNLLTTEEIESRGSAEGFIAPEVVADSVLAMASLPYHANVLEMTILPTKQPFIGRG
jgi:NAD(P)-dependent dehydrogenase (short-subunit alcohol dehydrogenase family)